MKARPRKPAAASKPRRGKTPRRASSLAQGGPGIEREQVAAAVRRARDWLLRCQVTRETRAYDTYEEPTGKWGATEDLNAQGRWVDGPLPRHLVGGFYANQWMNPLGARRENEVRRQYHSTWHTAQIAVALLDALDFEKDRATEQAVELAWAFLRQRQVPDGEFAGVFVEKEFKDLQFPLQDFRSFSQQNAKAYRGYASYDNIETCLFPLELYRRRKDRAALEMALANARFYLERHRDLVLSDIETHTHSISGMNNDAVYGRLGEYTGDAGLRDVFARQVRKLNLLGLDLRAGNNVRNMYWDCTPLLFALESRPDLAAIAGAKLAFIGEHTLAAQKESGVLWHRFREPGVVDDAYKTTQDGAATNGMILAWGALYDRTGDPRWLRAIRRAVGFAVAHQYGAKPCPEFDGAFEYDTVVEKDGRPTILLRTIATSFGVRALVPLLTGGRRWAEDFWKPS
jgi:hypothetical protein